MHPVIKYHFEASNKNECIYVIMTDVDYGSKCEIIDMYQHTLNNTITEIRKYLSKHKDMCSLTIREIFSSMKMSGTTWKIEEKYVAFEQSSY